MNQRTLLAQVTSTHVEEGYLTINSRENSSQYKWQD